MFQAEYLFALKQPKLSYEISIVMQVVLVVQKNQSLNLIRHFFIQCLCYCNIVLKNIKILYLILSNHIYKFKLILKYCNMIIIFNINRYYIVYLRLIYIVYLRLIYIVYLRLIYILLAIYTLIEYKYI
jgi:hypothetical protein